MKRIFFLIPALFLFGCALLSSVAENSFTLKKSVDFNCDSWQISVCDGEKVDILLLNSNENSFSLDLPKNVVLGILAYPIKDGRKQPPLGAVYPYSQELTESESFPAYVVDRLYRSTSDSYQQAQDFISRFNWEKFIATCKEFEDPWKLDSDRIVQSIASASFKKSDMKISVE